MNSKKYDIYGKNKSVCKGGGLDFVNGRMFFAEFRGKGCGDGLLYQ